MEKTIEVAGKTIRIRSLKWGEKEDLRAEGLNVARPDRENSDTDAMVARVVGACVLDEDKAKLDDMEILQVYEIYRQILEISYVGEKDTKN